jgi:hypothetical protein
MKGEIGSVDGVRIHETSVPFVPRNIPASAPTNRKNRRALVKALGNRQFKKLYRKAQA